MATNPSTEVYLYKDVPFDSDNEHTILWVDSDKEYGTAKAKQEQEKYFTQTNKPSRSYSNYSYQRVGTNKIQIKDTYDNVSGHSYMRFRNQAHENKWWYCFITAIDYINENCTEVSYEVDLLQTYQFDWDLKECFIERATTYCNLVPEDIPISDEYILDKQGNWFYTPNPLARKLNTDSFNITLAQAEAKGQAALEKIWKAADYIYEAKKETSVGFIPGINDGIGIVVCSTIDPRSADVSDQPSFKPFDPNARPGNQWKKVTTTSLNQNTLSAGSYYYAYIPKLENEKNNLGLPYTRDNYVGLLIDTLRAIEEYSPGAVISAYMCPPLYKSLKVNNNNWEKIIADDTTKPSWATENVYTQGWINLDGLQDYDIGYPPVLISWKVLDELYATTEGLYTAMNGKTLNYPYRKITLDSGDGKHIDFDISGFIYQSSSVMIDWGFHSRFSYVGQPQLFVYPSGYYTAASGSYFDPVYADPSKTLIIDNFPKVAFDSDAYKAWLNQNGSSVAWNVLSSTITGATVGSIGGPAGAAGGAALGLVKSGIQQGIQAEKASKQANNITGTPSGSALAATDNLRVRVYYKYLKYEELQRVDNYFSKFGYAVKDMMIPDLKHGLRYTYIKTMDCKIDGNFTAAVHDKLCEIFNNGLTFWRSDNCLNVKDSDGVIHPSTVGEYPVWRNENTNPYTEDVLPENILYNRTEFPFRG